MSEIVKRRPGRPSKVRLEAEAEAEKRKRELDAQNRVFTAQENAEREFLESLPSATMPFATLTRTYHGYNVVTGKLTLRDGAPHCHRCGVSQEATVADIEIARPESRWVAEARLRTALSLHRNWLAQQLRPAPPPERKPWVEIGADKLLQSQLRIDNAVKEILAEDVVSPYLHEIPTRGKVTQ